MTTHAGTTAEFVWNGVLDPGQLRAGVIAARHRLADAARTGDWATMLRLLDEPGRLVDVNGWRPGGTAWFTPLHQAAWHGAPAHVAAELVARGALRSLGDAHGRTAFDVRLSRDAKQRSSKGPAAQSDSKGPAAQGDPSHPRNLALRSLLDPPASPLTSTQVRALDTHLAAVIEGRISGELYNGRHPRTVLRYPPVGILHEIPGQRLWFPVPGMYGGFEIELRQGYLEVMSWSRVVGGSGEAHVVTEQGAVLVDRGFV